MCGASSKPRVSESVRVKHELTPLEYYARLQETDN